MKRRIALVIAVALLAAPLLGADTYNFIFQKEKGQKPQKITVKEGKGKSVVKSDDAEEERLRRLRRQQELYPDYDFTDIAPTATPSR
jgi:hypothetical protein